MAEPELVQCSRCDQVKRRLESPPLSGDLGRLIYDNVCQECWATWFEQSVNMINHYGLTPALPDHRKQLYEIMKDFLNL